MNINTKNFKAEVEENDLVYILKITLKENVFASEPTIYWNTSRSLEYLKQVVDSTRSWSCVGFSSETLSSNGEDNFPSSGSWYFSNPAPKPKPKPKSKAPRRRTPTKKKPIRNRISSIAEECDKARQEEKK